MSPTNTLDNVRQYFGRCDWFSGVDGGAVQRHAHAVETVVDIQCDTGDTACHGAAQKKSSVTDIVVVQVLSQRGVGEGVVNGLFDKGLLAGCAANGAGGARLERTSRDGVDADSVLAASFECESTGITLELSLGGRHTTTVSWNDLLGSNVGE